jgi:hypothetical protein
MDDLHRDRHTDLSLTRRRLVAATALTGASVLAYPSVAAASTPVASPVAVTIDQDRLMALSDRLSGGATLNTAAAGDLASLLSAEPDIEASFAELETVTDFTPETLAGTSPAAQTVAANILQFWFLGRYADQPVTNRADYFFSLASWQTLPYATQQSLCKSFGYWALEIDL